MQSKKITLNYTYSFPAIRGGQARREYYTALCSLNLIGKLFKFDYEDLSPELRAQRVLYKGRKRHHLFYLLQKYLFKNIREF